MSLASAVGSPCSPPCVQLPPSIKTLLCQSYNSALLRVLGFQAMSGRSFQGHARTPSSASSTPPLLSSASSQSPSPQSTPPGSAALYSVMVLSNDLSYEPDKPQALYLDAEIFSGNVNNDGIMARLR